jgi:hypothetical protein
MFGKGVFQEEENLLRDIIRSVDKKIDYSAKEADGTKFSLHVKLRNHEGEIILDLEDLKAAKSDMIRRHHIRQKIKARCEHLDKSRYGDDILGLKPAKLLRASPKPEPMVQRSSFGRGGPRR